MSAPPFEDDYHFYRDLPLSKRGFDRRNGQILKTIPGVRRKDAKTPY